MPNDLALDGIQFSRYKLVTKNLPCSNEVNQTTDLDQLLGQDCFLRQGSYIVESFLN
jgi:hypothetical protein